MTLATFIIILGFVVTSVITATTWKNNIDNQMTITSASIWRVDKNQQKIIEKQEGMITKQAEQEVLFIEIRTDLKWIRRSMEED